MTATSTRTRSTATRTAPPDSKAECAAGRTFCSGGFITCEPFRQPSDEICDNLDNDCDGSIDEQDDESPLSIECYGAHPDTVDVGICTRGARVCADGQFGDCVGQVLPISELCDGLDNDCDGSVDEGQPEAGEPCDTGLDGACRAGTTSCFSGMLECAQNNMPTDEVCDGIDNDCDGTLDEDEDGDPITRECYEGDEGTLDVGTCAAGEQTCVDGEFGVCEGDVLPILELCNNLDDDCDSSADEGNPASGFVCNTGFLGVCAFGQTDCGTGSSECVPDFTPSDEICDGFDNDCDGEIDEANDGSGDPLTRDCYGGPPGTLDEGICVGGYQTCVSGNYGTCQDDVRPAPELCDGIDNDCDGTPRQRQPRWWGSV